MAQFLLVVNYASRGLVEAAKYLRTSPEFSELELLIVTNKSKYILNKDAEVPITSICTDFGENLAQKIKPYAKQIRGVVCRGDKNIQFLRKLVPLLPPTVRVASEHALQASTDKKIMRQLFAEKTPDINPAFLEINDASPSTIKKLEVTLGYPMIIKPAHLASSLLIKRADNRQELESGLNRTLRAIDQVYKAEGRADSTKIIAEAYLTGEFYSIDAYVLGPEQLYYCPPVRYVPADQIGIDDFFLYKRFVPTDLSNEEISAANEACHKAIAAVGLSYSSAHVELVRTAKGWKIIELGPRIGRFRHQMYNQAYGINHILNDVRIHLGKEPEIKTKLLNYCAAYSLYPQEEGKLTKIGGLEQLKAQPEVKSLKIFAKSGQSLKFAKNGGHAAGEFLVVSPDKNRFEGVCDWIDQRAKVLTK